MKFKWVVHLRDEQGQLHKRDFVAGWSPAKEYVTPESIGIACAAQTYVTERLRAFPESVSDPVEA